MASPYCSEIEIENVIASLQLVFNPFPRSIEARIFLAGSIPTKHKFIYLAEPNGEDGKHSFCRRTTNDDDDDNDVSCAAAKRDFACFPPVDINSHREEISVFFSDSPTH